MDFIDELIQEAENLPDEMLPDEIFGADFASPDVDEHVAPPVAEIMPDEEPASEGPSTPKKKATPAKRKNTAKDATPVKKSKSTQSTPGSARTRGNKISDSFDELPEQDRMLLSWKDEGKSWPEIKAEWERLTGKKPGGSTLAVRFSRLKANLAAVSETDLPHLVVSEAKAIEEIEAEVADIWAKKWARVSKLMEEAGTTNYSPATLEKCYKKLKAAGTLPAGTLAATPADSGEDETKMEEN